MAHNSGYDHYLRSPAWRRRRARALKRAGNRCEWVENGKRCWAQSRLQTHHRHYRTFGHEKAADLQVLCADHHAVAELMKLYCEKCYKPVFSTVAKAMAFWKIIRRAYPKDWADAITAAKNAAKRCQKCKDDEGRTS